MQKRYWWVFVFILSLTAGTLLFLSHLKKEALAQLEQGAEEAKEGNFAQAISLLEKTKLTLLSQEKKILAWTLLGEGYGSLGRQEEAKKSWSKILEIKEAPAETQEQARAELAKIEEEIAAAALLDQGKNAEEKKDLVEARTLYKEVFTRFPKSQSAGKALDQYGKLSVGLLLSKAQGAPYAAIHLVRPGESLASIAKKYNMTLDLLMEANGLKSTNIHPNDRLKVYTAQFSLEVNKTNNTLKLLANDELVKCYAVGTGKEGSTPIGNFKITSKLSEPVWYHPGGGVIPYGDAENLLGTRWMGINSPGYGIHGTWDPQSVGKQSSAGCIRLYNEEVEELYKIVTEGTSVTIVE